MCEKNNLVFKSIPQKRKANPDNICVFGWNREESSEQKLDDNVEYGFWTMALAYYESAEMLYDKFVQSQGHYEILDSAGTTMCFLYRHYVELFLKYLYLKFACPSDEEYKAFLKKKGHDLDRLWNATKPLICEKEKRYSCTADINMVNDYIMDIDLFDKDSMTMRYPITKRLTQTKERTRLDIPNLHDRMKELHDAFDAFDCDFPKYELPNLPQEKVDTFLSKYLELRPKIVSFLEILQSDSEEKEQHQTCSQIVESLKKTQTSPFGALSDDELMLLDTLYYTGRAIKCHHLILPKIPSEARIVAAKMCVVNMERNGLEFGNPINDNQGVTQKRYLVLAECVSKVMMVIDQDYVRC